MIIQALQTPPITSKSRTLLQILDQAVQDMPQRSVLAITSKIVSLCEGRTAPIKGTSKQKLIERESDFYPLATKNKSKIHLTIAHGLLTPDAGVDESNANGMYVLWPSDAQKTVNQVRAHLARRFGHQELGVIITDSNCQPLRRGVYGAALAFSGIKPLKNYIGQTDLFGRPFKVSQSDIVSGLAAAAVLAMGEGAESTPLALISEATMVEFVPRNPTDEELASTTISLEEDLFGPFLQAVAWQKGGRHKG